MEPEALWKAYQNITYLKKESLLQVIKLKRKLKLELEKKHEKGRK